VQPLSAFYADCSSDTGASGRLDARYVMLSLKIEESSMHSVRFDRVEFLLRPAGGALMLSARTGEAP